MSAAAGRAVRWAACIVIVLNMLDAVWTLTFIRLGAADEGNPLMDQALSHGPLLFMLAKLSLVSLSVLLLWRLRHRRAAGRRLLQRLRPPARRRPERRRLRQAELRHRRLRLRTRASARVRSNKERRRGGVGPADRAAS